MNKKFKVVLPGSEHKNITIKLDPSVDEDRVATIKFPSDGMDIKLYMMESDLRMLAHAILDNTNSLVDGQRGY